ncbi:hypothetical protein DFH06DRAFT_1482180 [Mycena polygramma]|nr:hypothetical protein DFH06DRAFT_1482180 [Mycena polygramma]
MHGMGLKFGMVFWDWYTSILLKPPKFRARDLWILLGTQRYLHVKPGTVVCREGSHETIRTMLCPATTAGRAEGPGLSGMGQSAGYSAITHHFSLLFYSLKVCCIAFFEWAAFLSWYFWAQVYYEDYKKLSAASVLTAVRMLPMTIAGACCNLFVVLVISRMPLIYLIVFGTSFTDVGALLSPLIDPSAPYWAFEFPAPTVVVFGADFIFAAGTLFVAKVSLPHEQSAGGLFQTLTQLGTSFGLAISAIAFNAVAGSATGADALLAAYKAAQWTAFGMAILCV